MPKVVTTESFIQKSKKVHGDTYGYLKVKYTNSKSKVKIDCVKHGIFEQKPTHHLQGSGCQKCYEEDSKKKKLPWGYEDWKEIAENSKNFDSFKIYTIKCWSGNEEFFKIGKTFTKIKRRFTKGKSRKIPYNYEVINVEFFEDARECCEREKELQNINKHLKYVPLKEFGGMQECFSKIERYVQIL